MDDFSEAMRNPMAKMTQVQDQEIAEFRDFYWSLEDNEKIQLKANLQKLADAANVIQSISPEFQVKVQYHTIAADENGEVQYSGRTIRKPSTLLKAIEAWEKGETYTNW